MNLGLLRGCFCVAAADAVLASHGDCVADE